MSNEDHQSKTSKKGSPSIRQTLTKGIFRPKLKVPSRAVESSKTIGTQNQELSEVSQESSISATARQWSVTLAAQPHIKDGFENLRKAINEYNVEASQQQRHLVDHENVRLEEVRKIAEGIQSDCERENSGKKIRSTMKNGLRKFCETSLYYSSIMDVLIQQNPEWVSLAWGTVKFLLMVPVEYQRVKENIATNLGSLGDKFAVVHIFTQFFPSANIINATAAMYAAFAEFLETSVRWLNDNLFKRIIKSTFRPFDTSLKPILEKINQSYGVLREHVEAQRLIRDFQHNQQHQKDLAALKTSAGTTDQKLSRVLQILEGLILEQEQPKDLQVSTRFNTPKKMPKQQKPGVYILPALGPMKMFTLGLEPMEHDFDLMKHRQASFPIMQSYEGINILRRGDFRGWISSTSSSLLWIDGYEKPGRPSWLGDLALCVTQAAFISGYEALYTFNSLRFHDSEKFTARTLIQRLSNHLLCKFPEIYETGDTDLLCPEIFLAAQTDIRLSWKIFVECLAALKSVAVYIVIEAIDRIQLLPENQDEFLFVLQHLSQLATPGAVKNKVIKVMITSTKPDAGFDFIFRETRRGDAQDKDAHVLIRVSPAAARSRKQRSIPGVKRRIRIPSNSHAGEGFDFHCEKILSDSDFIPEPDDIETENISDSEKSVIQPMEFDEDFDIFDEMIESSQDKNQGSDEVSDFSSLRDVDSNQTRSRIASNSSAMSSDGSLDIFGVI
ncbi:uncharacterized protein GGS22DRAFT_186661 [Annulohypoxylon maeteangense]|uniref:uncharacterized protein n=1 Tax=Annulohypoxylon maeteangense TaxID=1927788 RepID=UPI0020089FE7|nr:uncharacterized protein GGS22DRAFT_186661 [Annulohypoxylon maeteangense]KAI0886593.1 hypothetical protein GGS22DRAFT_186661 [Annulohypoxylon maeteangense]